MRLQVLALDVILANGTRQVFTNETHPFIMRVRWNLTASLVLTVHYGLNC